MSDESLFMKHLIELSGKMGEVNQTASAAHKRMDRFEIVVREDFQKIIEQNKLMMTHIDGLKEHMNKGKGWAGAFNLLASLFGGAIVAGVIYLLKNGG